MRELKPHYNPEFGRDEIRIGQGEYFATGENLVISTLLGSCVSVVLFDRLAGLGGMNHFLLPQPTFTSSVFEDPPKLPLEKGDIVFSEHGRFGVHAMELLINALLQKGADRSNLEAKVFGGSRILSAFQEDGGSVPDRNVEFAFSFLLNEGIPISSHSVGGNSPRTVFVLPKEGRVFVR